MNCFWLQIAGTLVGIASGALITWWVARSHYQRSTKELNARASELVKLNTIALRALEDAGIVKLNRDGNNNIIGIVWEASARVSASFGGGATATVTRPDEQPEPEAGPSGPCGE